MSNLTIVNARAVTGGRVQPCNIRIVDGKIQGILPPGDTYGKTFDAKNLLMIPGLIDLHTHGGAGVDFNNTDPKGVCAVRDFYASQGATCFLPTLCADSEENLLRSVVAIAKAKNELGCSQIYGIHLEGPFLNKKFKGAMPEDSLINPDYNLYKRLQNASGGIVRRITIAPELPGAVEFIKKVKTENVSVSLGHSAASFEETEAAFEAGAVSATHLFNAMLPLEHHQPGIIGASFATDLYCEAICDGRHLHPGTVRMIYRAKNVERLLGITDSIAAAGLGDGLYKLGAMEVVVKGPDAKLLSSGTRAGSILTICQGVKNLMDFVGLPVETAVRCYSETPAKMMGIFHQKGSIDVGKDADLVLLDKDFQVRTTFSCGVPIYQA